MHPRAATAKLSWLRRRPYSLAVGLARRLIRRWAMPVSAMRAATHSAAPH